MPASMALSTMFLGVAAEFLTQRQQWSGAPPFALFAKGGILPLYTRGPSPHILLIPPFPKRADNVQWPLP